jgi:hypothetical protein
MKYIGTEIKKAVCLDAFLIYEQTLEDINT